MLGIIKGDIRYEYLSKMISNSIISNNLLDFINIDDLLLPISGINDDYTIKQSNLNLLDILKQNSIKRIYTGNISKRLEELCIEYNIKLINFMSGSYIVDNAKLTAKGVIHYLGNDEAEISDYNILVVGYGNIAHYLCKLLDVYEVKYSVFTLNELEKKYLTLDNKIIEHKLNGLGYDIIINTIPFNLNWDYKSLVSCKIIDVASNPYGFDMYKIKNYKIEYYILNALPSKYCPYTAAKILKKTLNFN